MIDPNERYVVTDKNWNKQKSWMDADSDYWKQVRNNNTSNILHGCNENFTIDQSGRQTRVITADELAKLKAP